MTDNTSTLDFSSYSADDSAGVVAQLAQQAVLPRPLIDGQIYAVLVGGDVTILETPGYTDQHEDSRAGRPREIKRAVTLADAESFMDYLARYDMDPSDSPSETNLELWADIDQRKIMAIVDGVDGWRKHTATLALKLSREWAEWATIDGKLLNQAAFAQFIEDHLSTIAAPDGGTLLDICQTLEARTDVQFKMQNILANGQRQFRWEEKTEARAGQKGDLAIPGELTLVLRPFQGSVPIAVLARFRYQIRDGQLSLGVKLVEPDKAIEDAFAAIVQQVQDEAPVRVNHGRP